MEQLEAQFKEGIDIRIGQIGGRQIDSIDARIYEELKSRRQI